MVSYYTMATHRDIEGRYLDKYFNNSKLATNIHLISWLNPLVVQ